MAETELHPAAKQLAEALRSGLQLRWPVPPPRANAPGPFPPGGSVRAFLTSYADPLSHQLPRCRSLLRRLVFGARYLVRALLSPWLRVQSHFNLATVSVVEQIEQRVRALEEAERALRQTVAELEKTLREKA